MSSRKLDHIRSLKTNLDKVLDSGNVDNERERISDILKSLYKVEMDSQTLRQSEIGSSIREIKRLFGEDGIGSMVKKVVAKWKKDCEASSSAATTAPAVIPSSRPIPKKSSPPVKEAAKPVAQSPSNEAPVPTLSLVRFPSGDEHDEDNNYWNDDELYTPLSDKRKSVMNSLTTAIQPDCPKESIAKFIAFHIECEINNLHNVDREHKAYRDKGFLLFCNLKKNQQLRENVISGRISFHDLVRLSAKELASDELKQIRKEYSATATLAKRADIYQLARVEIAKANNIDLNKGGEFRCGKCKSTNTIFTEKQTRSSDEPMTVFICCMNCGKRWKR